MNGEISIVIDGIECTCEKGEYLYDVARRNGIFIPVLCRSDSFEEHSACCRVCIVEVISKGRSKVVASCVYPIDGPIEVRTDSEKIREERGVIFLLLAKRTPGARDTFDAHMLSEACGIHSDRLVELAGEKCVLCGLCVQGCNAMGAGVLSTIFRGTDKRVATPFDEGSDACIGCLTCARICPTGAIEYTRTDDTVSIWHRDFDVVHCKACGRPLGTRETVEHAALLAGEEPAELCDSCKREAIAQQMAGAWPYEVAR